MTFLMTDFKFLLEEDICKVVSIFLRDIFNNKVFDDEIKQLLLCVIFLNPPGDVKCSFDYILEVGIRVFYSFLLWCSFL
jgi:hypothetical protein